MRASEKPNLEHLTFRLWAGVWWVYGACPAAPSVPRGERFGETGDALDLDTTAAGLRLGLDAYFQSHPGLLWVKSSKESRRIASMLNWVMIVVYVIAMVAAGWNTNASLILYFSIPILYFVTVAGLKADSRTRARASDLDWSCP